jgi:hypothetical protein
VPAEVAAGIVDDLRQLSNVEGARALERRAIDPASLIVLIQVVGGALGVVGSAWALIDRIRKSLSARKVTGAAITLPNGTRVELDEVTEEQLARLMAASGRAES